MFGALPLPNMPQESFPKEQSAPRPMRSVVRVDTKAIEGKQKSAFYKSFPESTITQECSRMVDSNQRRQNNLQKL